MSFEIIKLHHVNVTVPAAAEAAARHFYGVVLGLRQIPKPDGPRKNVGAWYEIGGLQLHLSIEDRVDNDASDRHVCYHVEDLASAKAHFCNSDIEVIPNGELASGSSRFFLRDPGGNLIEITRA